MKRVIRAKSNASNIDYKIKDFLADWAKKDAKKGKPALSMKDFKEAMKDEELKADQDRYDYYLECYNNACGKQKKTVKSSTQPSLLNRTEADILRDIYARMHEDYEILYYGTAKDAEDNFNRGGNIYVFRTKDGNNGYRVFFDTENKELIFQQLAIGFYDSKGNLWFDDPVDVAQDYGDPDTWFKLVSNWVRECEAEDPEFTEYEE